MTSRMNPPEGGAVVRMYCTGLGDCFLLGFSAPEPGTGGRTTYVLIDCGVWKGTSGATPWMRRIWQSIREEVGDQGLDLLVATHQHWDHLSGFAQAKDLFLDPALQVKQVWLPWTEDPEDLAAARMAKDRRLALRAAVAAAGRLRDRLDRDDPRLGSLDEVLKFAGHTPPGDEDARRDDEALFELGFGASPDLLLGAGPSTDDLLEIVRGKVDRPRYLRPSLRPLTLDEGQPPSPEGLRIYVLGPPLDPKYLGKDDPSSGPRSEVYLSGLAMNEEAALLAAAWTPDQPSDTERERRELAFPFDRWQRIPRQDAAASEHGAFFSLRYLDESPLAPDWRRIDADWLRAAEQLALNLDDHVNNTSLVLAFELGAGGPVLLFPGDAQVGSWLSWHELESVDGLTAESLLARTVLYKVGHHGSHNATLKDLGLRKMTDTANLVALLPVDEREARKPKGRNRDGWAMPYGKLLEDLIARTEGRVLRADRLPEKPAGLPDWTAAKDERWERFRRETAIGTVEVESDGEPSSRTLFLQYTVHPTGSPPRAGRP